MNIKSICNALRSKAKLPATGLLFAVSIIAGGQVSAEQLPSMAEPPWTGYFSGNIQRNFEFGVSNEGYMEIYLINKKKERVGGKRTIKIYPQIMVDNGSGEKLYKKLKEDEGFTTDAKPGLEHESVTFTAQTAGDAKVEITVKYGRHTVSLDGRILEKGTLTKGKLSMAFKVVVPAMYTDTYKDERKAKGRMKRDKFRFIRAKDGKRVTLKTYEKVKLLDEKNALEGVRELEVDMDGLEGKNLIFATDGGKGVFTIQHPRKNEEGMLWEGYEVLWERPFEEANPKDAMKPLVIEIK